MARNLLNPGCGICDDCAPCETPTRTSCQFRSGVNGETLTTRPTVAINVVITPGTTPACGACNFDEDYTYTCGVPITDILVACNLTGPPRQRRLEVFIGVALSGAGFDVSVFEYVLGSSFKHRVYRFLYDDFAYTDCDGNPAIDEHGAESFTFDQLFIADLITSDLCDYDSTVTAVNN